MPDDKLTRLIAQLLAEYAARLTLDADDAMTLPGWLDVEDIQALARDRWNVAKLGLPTKAQVAEWCVAEVLTGLEDE